MPSISLNSRFFGVDLGALWRDTRRAWARVAESPALSWLSPQPQVVMLRAEGGETFWVGDAAYPAPVSGLKASFTALELPEDYVLRRTLEIPRLSGRDMDGALALQAKNVSPFPSEDLVWGSALLPSREGGGNRVELVLASRKQIAQYVATQTAHLGAITDFEVWALAPGQKPVVIQGYGETVRQDYGQRVRRTAYGLLAVIGILLGALAVTPSLQLYLRASQAAIAFQELAQRTAPQVREREQMMQSLEKLKALADSVTERLEPLRVLDMLTQVLPDDTAIQTFKLQGRKVTLSGVTGNSSALMQLLGEQPGLRDVKAPSAATRLGASTSETYVIEFALDPKVFGVVPPSSGHAAVPAIAAASDAATAGATVAQASGPTASQPAMPAASAASAIQATPPSSAASAAPPAIAEGSTNAAPVGVGKPSFGGATFGGAATRPTPKASQ